MRTKCTAESKLFIGIDIHKRSWRIHTRTDLFDGQGVTMPPEAAALRKYVSRHYRDYEVWTAYEAGCCGYSAHRKFEEYGWNSIVFNPADIHRTGNAQYQKTDGLDARLISRELRDGRLRCITIPDIKREQLRCLFRRRNELIKDFRRVKTRIKSELLYLGVEIPKRYDNSNWSKAFLEWIGEQTFKHYTADRTLSSQLEHYEFLDESIRDISNELRKYCRSHYRGDYYLLRSIPGIGGIVACGILSELGDLRRFNSIKHLAGYVGLVPGIHQSGDSSRSRGLTPRGNRLMRSYFVEAAWQALRVDPVMQAYYRSHGGKDSKSILIKVARKLLSRTLAVIKTETPYEIGIVE